MSTARIVFSALLLMFASVSTAARDLQIVSSIKPVDLIARAIAPPGTEFTTLVPPGSSPHTYQMKISQRRALNEADLILWMGPDLENFLTRTLQGPDFSQRTLALTPEDSEEETHQAQSSGDAHESHHDDHEAEEHGEHDGHKEHDSHGEHAENGHHDHHDEEGHHHSGVDPHGWLDPALTATMAGAIATAMIDAGANPIIVRANLERFLSDLTGLERELQAYLEPARAIDLFIYHGAFKPFAEHYRLKIAGELTYNPAVRPGARHMAMLQDRLAQSETACLLQEPEFSADWWLAMSQGKALTIGRWDPLAADIPSVPNGYLLFQKAVADAVVSCIPNT